MHLEPAFVLVLVGGCGYGGWWLVVVVVKSRRGSSQDGGGTKSIWGRTVYK